MSDHAVLLSLYQAAREESPGAFEKKAIGLLGESLRFDSAIWGAGRLKSSGAVTPHVVHLHEQPEEALAAWTKLNANDPVAALVMRTPGIPVRFHAPTLFSHKGSAPMREYARRYGRQSYMVGGLWHGVQPGMMVWLSLYRTNADAHFNDQEQAECGRLMPHLHEAQKINRRIHMMSGQLEELAIADHWGFLHTPWASIESLLKAEWSHVESGQLPQQLVLALTRSRSRCYFGRPVDVHARIEGGVMFLRFCPHRSLQGISGRERQIAEQISRGLSAKEVGQATHISPETVRVHLRNIYRKLGVRNQAELSYLMGKSSSSA
jgi:DNA-binding CsgD family transcriptional regulator